jgi:hypothetical protein
MTKKQAIEHNQKVVSAAVKALFDFNMVDPLAMMTNRKYANDNIANYLNAENVTRQTLGLPKVKLYDINEFDEEDD